MAVSNLKILYLLEIMRSTSAERAMNANDISDLMDRKYGLKISRQMVYQLIATLKECDYPIVTCSSKNDGWYMEHHKFDDYQLKIMIDAVANSRCITEKESNQIKKKLMALTSKQGRDKLRSLYAPRPQSKPKKSNTQEYVDLIMEAALKGRKIAFYYTYMNAEMKRTVKMNGDQPKEYELNPYSMKWSNDNYYVIGGHDKHRPELTNYRLDRMEHIRISEKPAIPRREFLGPDPDFVIQTYIDKAVDHYHGERISISLALYPSETNMKILYDFVGAAPRISPLEGGLIKATFRTSDTPTLVGWLIKNKTSFKVLSPDSLRERIIEDVKSILEMYEE